MSNQIKYYRIRLVRILCDATPAVMLSPAVAIPANVMRHADNLPATGLPPAVANSEPQQPLGST